MSKKAVAPTLTVTSAWPDTMGLEQAAKYLRLGRDATRSLFELGDLPGVSLNQKHLVFRRVALDSWLAQKEMERERSLGGRSRPAAIAKPVHRTASAIYRRGAPPDLRPYEATSAPAEG